jgi:hypothetical protein
MSQLTLPAPLIRRILERSPTVILHRREIKPGTFEVHNQHTIRTNSSRTRAGMVHLIEDSFVMIIEIGAVSEVPWAGVDQKLVRAAGFKTTDEWRETQLVRKGSAWACVFRVAEDARWLHRKISRGYTRNPALGLPEQALDEADLARYSSENWIRHAEHKKREQDEKSLASRVTELERQAAAGEEGAKRSLFVIRQRLDQSDRKRDRDAA